MNGCGVMVSDKRSHLSLERPPYRDERENQNHLWESIVHNP